MGNELTDVEQTDVIITMRAFHQPLEILINNLLATHHVDQESKSL